MIPQESYEGNEEFKIDEHHIHQLHKFQMGSDYQHQEQQVELANKIYTQCLNLIDRADIFLTVCSSIQQTYEQERPPFFMMKIKRVESENQKQLLQLANKLKVFSLKAQKQWGPNCEYSSITFMERINQTLQFVEFNEQKYLTNTLLKQLKQKFPTISLGGKNKHKLHYSRHSEYIDPDTVFYVNFQITNLLFLQQNALPFDGNLLFCPIIIQQPVYSQIEENGEKLLISISPWYLNLLRMYDQNWDNYTMMFIIKHHGHPQLYAKIDNTQVQYFNENQICVFIRKLRRYIYLQQIQKWLWRVFGFREDPLQKNLTIPLTSDYCLEISIMQGHDRFSQAKQQPCILESVLKFCMKDDHTRHSRQQIKKMFVMNMNLNLLETRKSITKPVNYFESGKYIYEKEKMINVFKMN